MIESSNRSHSLVALWPVRNRPRSATFQTTQVLTRFLCDDNGRMISSAATSRLQKNRSESFGQPETTRDASIFIEQSKGKREISQLIDRPVLELRREDLKNSSTQIWEVFGRACPSIQELSPRPVKERKVTFLEEPKKVEGKKCYPTIFKKSTAPLMKERASVRQNSSGMQAIFDQTLPIRIEQKKGVKQYPQQSENSKKSGSIQLVRLRFPPEEVVGYTNRSYQ
jgi:hypothetical protein